MHSRAQRLHCQGRARLDRRPDISRGEEEMNEHQELAPQALSLSGVATVLSDHVISQEPVIAAQHCEAGLPIRISKSSSHSPPGA